MQSDKATPLGNDAMLDGGRVEVDPTLCLRCKGGRNLCGLGYCPRMARVEERFPAIKVISSDFMGPSPPGVFVGRYGYPAVNLSPLVVPYGSDDPALLEDTRQWFGLSVEDIIALRSQLYRARKRIRVTQPQRQYTSNHTDPSRVLESAQIIAQSRRSMDMEVHLSRPPPPLQQLKLDLFVQPMGPAIEVRKVDVVDNPAVPRRVDALVNDTDATATTAMREIYGSGIDEGYITRLLSVGLLGRGRGRKIVPTRWAITAVDDTLAKALIPKVRDMGELGAVMLHYERYIGNSIFVLFIPGPWSFEMVETWMKGAFWAPATATISDWEDWRGRKDYASNVTGAYYAARLAVLEHLVGTLKRQASVLIYREITEDYLAPLGVWVIRETTRRALSRKPLEFSSVDEAVAYVTNRVRAKAWSRRSKLLKERRIQRRLEDFLPHHERPSQHI